jgi:DNA-binding CsgD family transcriptional regulator
MFAMRADAHPGAFVGRRREQQLLAGLLGGAREGHSGVLVVRGEAGIGKTALIDAVIGQAVEFRAIRCSGAESEMELAYAGVQQVCAPLTKLLDRLPKPQRAALETVLGLAESGAAPDPLLVGLAVLTLLAEAGSQQPTVCVIDDAHWVDAASVQALAFAARRLLADRVVMLFAARHHVDQLSGLPELVLGGLSDSDARALLSALMPGRLSDSARESILAESGGNPLALRELHGALSPVELAGGYGLAEAKSISGRIEDTYLRQFHALPEPTRLLLLIAAAEPTGELPWLWAAAARLGIGVDAAAPAERARLLTFDGRVRFRHPLVRSAIYGDAPLADRRRVHDALAHVISGRNTADHRAWHRARSAEVPDEDIAVELVAAAEQARARGGVAAAAAFMSEAVAATPDRTRRARRALAAAETNLDAGALDKAGRLLDLAAELTDDDWIGAHVELMRAKVAFAAHRGRDGPPLLLAAATRLNTVDASLARETYLEALMSSLIVGRLPADETSSPATIARAARAAVPARASSRSVDMLLDGLVIRLTDGYVAGAPLLKAGIAEYAREAAAKTAQPRWHDITMRVCLDLFDLDNYTALTKSQLEMLRAAGKLTQIASPLSTYAGLCVTGGEFGKAAAALDELDLIAAATDTPPHRVIGPYLAAYRGRQKECLESAEATIEASTVRGEGTDVTVARYAVAILHIGLAQYPEALSASLYGLEYDDVGMANYLMIETIEAAARCGETPLASEVLDELSQRAKASGTDTALGLEARSRALIAGDADADVEFRRALDHLQRSPAVVYRARTHLAYGEWLRRVSRRADAQAQLRTAHDMFDAMGAEGFAARARRELQAAGEKVRQRGQGTMTPLTTQERHITRLAREGYTNSEIGAQLFISARTVEWHLGRIYAKLGVTSRRELRSVALQLV